MRCLHELGFANTVCTYHHGRDVAGVTTRRIRPLKNYQQTSAGPSKYKPWADWRLLWLCVSEYRRSKPAVIHAHLHEGVFIGVLLKLFFFWRRTPLLADMQGSLTGELEAHGAFQRLPFLRWPTHFLERILMWCASAIVCSSQHSLQKLQTEFNIPNHKISLAQDGADAVAKITPAEVKRRRIELNLPTDKTIIVYSGALLDSKGLAELKTLIKESVVGTPELAKISTRLHYLIIGYPKENLQPFLADNQLNKFCTLTGQIDFAQLPEYLSCCDLAIDPKHSAAGEGSGKMLNYIAAGLPVVAFNSANNREFLPADTKLANSPAELLALLVALLGDRQLREHQARAAFSHFEHNYSWQVTRDQLQQVYRALGSGS